MNNKIAFYRTLIIDMINKDIANYALVKAIITKDLEKEIDRGIQYVELTDICHAQKDLINLEMVLLGQRFI